MIKKIVMSLCGFILILLITTYLALEQSDVLVVESFDRSAQNARYTHIWFVVEEGHIYLEAGHPENPWVQDLAKADTIGIQGANLDGWYAFSISNSQTSENSDHLKIRALMRKKYGWRDWWVALLFDTSQSQLVSLTFTDRVT